jgi:protein involved in polysaccharide export with SLBB domain
MRIRFIVVVLFVFGSLTNQVRAQDYNSEIPVQLQYSDRPAQYILGSGDVLLISVNLWGHVLKPGMYSVPSSFGIIDLLSSAGGPLKTARLNDVRIVRKNQEVITVNIEQFIKTGNQDLLVPLQPGDIIIVSGSISDIFVRVVQVMANIAIILNVIVLANRL